ncbi:hypothetical protein L7F22_021361 [Adiantum nelumboides]|nr:hypothetical protein [Adiantum nelumboides]
MSLSAIAQRGMQVPMVEYTAALKECAKFRALEHGRCVHIHIHLCAVPPSIMLENALINMYGKSGSLHDAQSTLMHLPTQNIFSWTAIITAYVKENKDHEAVELFKKMRSKGITPDKYVVITVLKACAGMEALQQGRCIHGDALVCNVELDCFLCSALVDMYAKCKSILDAQHLFENMRIRDVISWNAMISGYTQQGPEKEAILLFENMQRLVVNPSEVTYAFVIKACARSADIEYGKRVHRSCASRNGRRGSSPLQGNAAVQLDPKWGYFFIGGCVQQGLYEKANFLFAKMHQMSIEPDGITFVRIVKASAGPLALEKARRLHAYIVERALDCDVFIGSTLVDMYAKCGSIKDARLVFTSIQVHDTVAWTTLLTAYVQQGLDEEDVMLFDSMVCRKVCPSETTFTVILKACSNLTILEWGRLLVNEIFEKGYELSLVLRSALLDMYSKCGNLKDAEYLFEKTCPRDVIAWTTMIAGYTLQGCGKEALGLFEQMRKEEQPNEVTFIGVLSGCSHAGLVDEAYWLFALMVGFCGIIPIRDHFACIVDLLSRAGRLEVAFLLLRAMLISANEVLWMSLLSVCGVSGNLEVAKQVAEEVMILGPQNSTAFVQLSNIYAMVDC